MAAAIGLTAPGAASAHATPVSDNAVISGVNCAPTPPWVSTYAFDGDLKVEGGCFTENGRVYVMVKHNNGTLYFKKWVTARDHPFLAGGWINVNTHLRAPCNGIEKNGYARGYDSVTKKWSAKFPVPICILYDDN
ncbi:hypothetical protein OG462_40665 [Streptomyces sp. NBC_01077]|uniref:hypothetical protein n=1 Tax=Streptomyces sp. NBC_01077 TaxID=2903746 RepID=UPI00386F6F38|nr:hypothetical protein OG462_40665 [Streptomyces sp. NBC_01077]